MTSKATGNDDLLLFVCGELAEERRQQVEKALLADSSLAREVDEMSGALAAVAHIHRDGDGAVDFGGGVDQRPRFQRHVIVATTGSSGINES